MHAIARHGGDTCIFQQTINSMSTHTVRYHTVDDLHNIGLSLLCCPLQCSLVLLQHSSEDDEEEKEDGGDGSGGDTGDR